MLLHQSLSPQIQVLWLSPRRNRLSDQATHLRELWNEFVEQQTPESRYAHAIDRLQPLLQNMQSGGGSWTTHGVTRGDVLRRMAPLQTELPDVWPFVLEVIERFFH